MTVYDTKPLVGLNAEQVRKETNTRRVVTPQPIAIIAGKEHHKPIGVKKFAFDFILPVYAIFEIF
jgi:hypothetical protein